MKYSFIDYPNTDGTTKKLLGFSIDWAKLTDFLRTQWKCDKVFIYIGVEVGDTDTAAILTQIEAYGGIVRGKTVFAYKNRDHGLSITCPSCGHPFIKHVEGGYRKKSNCDVDLTVDAMEHAGPDSEFYLFTGDGDFESLVRNVVGKGTKVKIISSSRKIPAGPRYFTSRLSTKLRALSGEYPDQVHFVDINNLKFRIQKT